MDIDSPGLISQRLHHDAPRPSVWAEGELPIRLRGNSGCPHGQFDPHGPNLTNQRVSGHCQSFLDMSARRAEPPRIDPPPLTFPGPPNTPLEGVRPPWEGDRAPSLLALLTDPWVLKTKDQELQTSLPDRQRWCDVPTYPCGLVA
jgi:hypothetical protein